MILLTVESYGLHFWQKAEIQFYDQSLGSNFMLGTVVHMNILLAIFWTFFDALQYVPSVNFYKTFLKVFSILLTKVQMAHLYCSFTLHILGPC